jgi:hypothetical protein
MLGVEWARCARFFACNFSVMPMQALFFRNASRHLGWMDVRCKFGFGRPPQGVSLCWNLRG